MCLTWLQVEAMDVMPGWPTEVARNTNTVPLLSLLTLEPTGVSILCKPREFSIDGGHERAAGPADHGSAQHDCFPPHNFLPLNPKS